MTSPPLPKKLFGSSLKVVKRGFNQARNAIFPISRPSSPHSPTLPGTSTANIPNVAPVVVRDRSHDSILSTPHPSYPQSPPLSGTNSADEVGEIPAVVENRSQDAILPPPHPSSQPPSSDKIKKAWGVTWSTLEAALRLLEKSADAFPPLKSAVSGLVACLDLAQVSHGCGFNTLAFSYSHRR